MRISLVYLVILFSASCNSKPDNSNTTSEIKTTQGVDTLKDKSGTIERYYLSEKAALDSIKEYKIDSLYKICLKMLYVIYGKEKIFDKTLSKSSTIGECDIRLYSFNYASAHSRRIDFEIFWRDSLPVNAQFSFNSLGDMMTSFSIDIDKKILINSSIGGVLIMPIDSFKGLYVKTLQDKEFKRYLEEYKSRINPKFKRLIDW